MKTLVKLQYFKPRGKHYSSGEYETEKEFFHEVIPEIRQLIVDGRLPGLVEGCCEFTVLLEPVEPWGVPHLFPVQEESSLRRLHSATDQLMAVYLRERRDKLPSDIGALELLEWACAKMEDEGL